MNEEQDIFILLKCVENQYAENMLDGDFYFSRNRYFIDLEEKQIDKGIGDKQEGVWSRIMNPQEDQVFIITEDGEELPLSFEKGIVRHTHSNLKDCPICCFTILSFKNDFDINEKQNTLTLKSEVVKKLSEQFAGRDLIVFTDIDEIIERIDTACNRENLSRTRGKVTYYDDENESHPLPLEEVESNPARKLLYKRKFFEFQKEFRYILKKPQNKDMLLNIGNIRDIAYNLGKIKAGEFQINIHYSKEAIV